MNNQLASLFLAVRDFIKPLLDGFNSLEALEYLFYRYGWRVSLDDVAFGQVSQVVGIGAAAQKFLQVADPLEQRLDADPGASLSLAELAQLGDAAATLFKAIGAFNQSSLERLPPPLGSRDTWDSIGEQIFDGLLEEYLRIRHPQAYLVLLSCGCISYAKVAGDGKQRVPYTRVSFDWRQLQAMLHDPVSALKNTYHWGDPSQPFDHQRLLDALGRVLSAIGVSTDVVVPGIQLDSGLPPDVVTQIRPDVNALRVTLLQDVSVGDRTSYEIGFDLLAAAQSGETNPSGLIFRPRLKGSAQQSVPLGDLFSLKWTAAASAGDVLGVAFFPGKTSLTGGDITLGTALEIAGSSKQPWYLLGNAQSARIEVYSPSLRFSLEGAVGDPEMRVRLGTSGASGQPSCSVIIPADDADSFVKNAVGQNTIKFGCTPELIWSSKTGIAFNGSPTPNFNIPLNLALGPIKLQNVKISITEGQAARSNPSFVCRVGLDVGGTIGPIDFAIQGIGFACDLIPYSRQEVLALPPGADGPVLGNLGISLHFAAPDGVGLAIDAAGVTGGGFLAHDDTKREYSGVLQLQFIDLALQAFGLITTQVAGSTGYSLLALVDAEFPPIQLGWGFTLDGVGGLLAVHRTASTDALHAALKAGQLSSILFPKSAITNAPVILGQLDTLFPTASGRFLFGPMALIGWGSPRMLKAAIAVVIELPEPVKVILLSRIELRVPDETTPAVRVNMDALGILDLGKNELSFDAMLFDSKLVDFTMSGAMALRAEWGSPDHSEFVLAIGGVHPKFTPPPDFPQLQRITIDMPSGHIAKLRLAAYLAVTSNTIQLGGNLDFYLGVSEFNVSGHLGFDALLHRHPFRFTSDISGKVAIMAGGDDIASVDLEGTFSGPKPYHLAGQFSVHIVFFDVREPFDYSWGGDLLAVLAPVVDVVDMLRTAVTDLHNWDALLPPGISPLVTARQIDDTSVLLTHPLGRPEVRERIVPLGLAITRFGESVPSGANPFIFNALQVGTGTIAHDTVQDDFAPAQFFELTDEEKLERPSFERHDAGMRVSALPVTSGAPVPKTAAYETFFVDTPGASPREDPGVPTAPPSLIDLQIVVQFGSAGRAVKRSAGRHYQAPGNPIRVAQPAFVLADKITMAPASIGPAAGGTFSDMHALLAGNPAFQILATHEMTAN
jgi:hypothetical protein